MKKIVSTIALALAVVAVVTLIAIGMFLDRIVKKSVGVYGSRMTQTTVAVDTVHLSLLTGSAEVKGLMVGNPEGYKMPQAIAVGTIAVAIDPATIFSRKVVIRSLRLESPEVTFEGGLAGNNLRQILYNMDSTANNGSGPLSTNAAAQPNSSEKFEVDDLVISGAKVQVFLTDVPGGERLVLPLPDIYLTNLGKGDEGITAADLAHRVLIAISSATFETVARAAVNLDKNAAILKRAGTNTVKKAGSFLENLLNKQ